MQKQTTAHFSRAASERLFLLFSAPSRAKREKVAGGKKKRAVHMCVRVCVMEEGGIPYVACADGKWVTLLLEQA